jgi:hypothetical protein
MAPADYMVALAAMDGAGCGATRGCADGAGDDFTIRRWWVAAAGSAFERGWVGEVALQRPATT